MYEINSLDIETFNDENGKIRPICVCFLIEGATYSEYYKKDCDIVLLSIKKIFSVSKNNKIIIYIHNINFDGYLIIESLSKQNNIKFDALIRNNNIYSVYLEYREKKIIFKCSYKIVPKSLDYIAKTFNLSNKMIFPHLFSKEENLFYLGKNPDKKYFKNEKDYEDFIKNEPIFDFKNSILKYCMNDVYITSSFIKIFKKIVLKHHINLDDVYSSPSLSIKIFIKKYNKNLISFNMKKSEKDLIRNSYFGGRCEVYGNPKEKEFIFHYDFSGMYAQCMLEKFPYGKIYIDNDPKNFYNPGFYYIEYNSHINIPVLPHRSKLNNKLMFTNGKNKGLFWFEEIILFEKMGGIVENVEMGLLYRNYDSIFKDFVNEFTDIRKENDIFNIFGKLVINSLYGRMGMDDIYSDKIIFNKKEFEDKNSKLKIISYKLINEYVIAEVEKNKSMEVKSNISIASTITSKARIKLYNAQQDVLKSGGNLLYSDTDSVFASYNRDVRNEKHGIVDWSIDKKKIIDAVFISSKTYGLKYEDGSECIKIKGFDNKNINFKKMKKKFYNKDNKIDINDNVFISKRDMEMFNVTNIKKLSLDTYDKRKFKNNMKETEPLFLDNYIIYK